MEQPKYRSVMLIDDQVLTNDYNEALIRNANLAGIVYVHTTASSAFEYLMNIARIGNAGADLIPSVIFLDIYMPVMDGYDFLSQFETLPKAIIEKVKVIILTSSQSNRDIEAAEVNSHVKQYLLKPLTPEVLCRL